jgi:hypothetical protein
VLFTEDGAVEDGEREKRLTQKLMMADTWRTKGREKGREENHIPSTDYSFSVLIQPYCRFSQIRR